jgi:hypothetical protein
MGWVWNDDPTLSPRIWNDSFKGEFYCSRSISLPLADFQIESRIFFGGN